MAEFIIDDVYVQNYDISDKILKNETMFTRYKLLFVDSIEFH